MRTNSWRAVAAGLVVGLAGTAGGDEPKKVKAVLVSPADGGPAVVKYVAADEPVSTELPPLPSIPPVATPDPLVLPTVPTGSRAAPVFTGHPLTPPVIAAPDLDPVSVDPAFGAAGCPTGGCAVGHKHRGKGDRFPCAHAGATVPPPLGQTVRSVFDMQRMNALAEYFVIYREDWLGNSTRLNDTGARHFGGIVRRLNQSPAPIKVEPTGNRTLDDRRVAAVIDLLAEAGVPTANRVVIGGTRAEGLRYRDIEQLYGRDTLGGQTGFGGGFGGFGGGFGGFGGFIR